MSKIRDEKMLFEMIDKRVSIEEELNRVKASVWDSPIKFNKYEAKCEALGHSILGYSIKLRRETKALDKKIDDKMKEMGLVDDLWS
jgi:hypothetical protein